MHLARALACVTLIARLAAAPPEQLPESVKALFNNPRLGRARLTATDGSVVEGHIARVTNQFVAVSYGHVDCGTFEWSAIADIQWLPYPQPRVTVLSEVARNIKIMGWLVYLLPVIIQGNIKDGFYRLVTISDARYGRWVSTSANGSSSRIELSRPRGVWREDIDIVTGRYRVEAGKLHLQYDSSAAEKIIPIRFDCAYLIFGNSNSLLPLWSHGRHRPASAPIVGRWREYGTLEKMWEFAEDGAFKTTVTRLSSGNLKKTKGGFEITWTYPSDPAAVPSWELHVSKDRLYGDVAGKPVEYRRAR
ncbi:MAG: hypothetical protein ACRD8O_01210 [Bryobacteraceae bacterium]